MARSSATSRRSEVTGGRARAAFAAASLAALCLALPAGAQQPSKSDSAPRALSLERKPWTGDFDRMLERRDDPRARALQPHAVLQSTRATSAASRPSWSASSSATSNKKYAKQLGKRPLTLVLHPDARATSCIRPGRGPRRHRRRQHHSHRGAAESRRLRRAGGRQADREVVVTGPAAPPHRTARRPFGQDRARARARPAITRAWQALNARFAKGASRQ